MPKKMIPVEIDGQTLYTDSLSCSVCGGIMTHADKYGMHCDKECEREDDKAAYKVVKGMLDSLFGPLLAPTPRQIKR